MHITINIEDENPLFNQLIEQIKQAVVNGDLSQGSPLPSIRQLANDLEINNKTVAKAYSLLERDSIIQSKGYRGSFIHPDAVANCDVNLHKTIQDKLYQTINSLRQLGVTDSEIRVSFAALMKNKNSGE